MTLLLCIVWGVQRARPEPVEGKGDGGMVEGAVWHRALVLRLERVRAHSGGLRREVTVLAATEVYL